MLPTILIALAISSVPHDPVQVVSPFVVEFNFIARPGFKPIGYILLRREDGFIHQWLPIACMPGEPWCDRDGTWSIPIEVDANWGHGKRFFLIRCPNVFEWVTVGYDPEILEQQRFPVERRIPFW